MLGMKKEKANLFSNRINRTSSILNCCLGINSAWVTGIILGLKYGIIYVRV